MTNNDILKRLRFALNIRDEQLIGMVEAGGKTLSPGDLEKYFLDEDVTGYLNCSDTMLTAFLDGLILTRRGPRKNVPANPSQNKTAAPSPKNNLVMKKLRIALELKETDIIDLFKMVDYRISGSEISALFRRSGHKNFRECGDQLLRNFIQGLVKKYRNI